MKRYIFAFTLTIFALITTYAFAGEVTIAVTKVALKYQGESDYRIYDISSVNCTINGASNTASYGPTSVATLTDESNDLPSGVITEIKAYGTRTGFYTNKWIGQPETTYDTPDNALNLLGSNIDLSTDKRKKVTVKFYGGQGGDGKQFAIVNPIQENL